MEYEMNFRFFLSLSLFFLVDDAKDTVTMPIIFFIEYFLILYSAGSKNLKGCSGGGGLNSTSSYCRRLGSAVRQQQRPSGFQLWSPRLRQRDERKRVLKLSLAKLRRIDDAESCLRRSVLLNNTLRRLQRETRDEKTGAATADLSSLSSSLLVDTNQRSVPDNGLDIWRNASTAALITTQNSRENSFRAVT